MQQQIDRCGDCHSCCKSFGWIDDNQIRLIELDIQYEWDRCNKLCDNNRCTIYDNRPKTCSDFECLYVESDLPEEYLPEKVGFVTDLRRDEHGLFLNIVPNESKKYNIDARKFGEENMENILVMKKTAEEMWAFPVKQINVSCINGEHLIEC